MSGEHVELWIRQAFETRLASWAEANGLKVEFENSEFDPPANAFYLRATLLVAPAIPSDLVDQVEHAGVFQIDVVGPQRIGTAEHYKHIANLRQLFQLDATLRNGPVHVTQRSPLRTGPGIQDAGTYFIPTSFEFVAQT